METPPRKLPPKKDVLDVFLKTGSARIFLDPRKANVVVPKWFAKQAELVLRVGYTLSPPIPDLVVSEEAVSCTLSFNRSPFWCKMPWNAVFAVVSDVDGRGVVWPDDVPIESQLLKPARPKPKLASVSSKEESPKEDAVEAAGEAGALSPSEAPPAAEAEAAPAEEGKSPAAEGEESRKDDAPAEPAKEDADADASKDGSDPSGKKPKRQLPPYLRVVK